MRTWPVETVGPAVPIAGRDAGPGDILSTYEAVGKAWAARRAKSLFEKPALDRFLAALPGPRVLDVGCGSGEPIALYLAASGCTVTGVDGAAAMASLFRANLPCSDVVVADMRGLAIGRTFDGILAWDSLFHLSAADQRTTFGAFAAHAAPGAALMFTSGLDAGEAIGVVEGWPVYHASLSPDGYREALAAAGFEATDFRPNDPEVDGRSVWLARYNPGRELGTDAAARLKAVDGAATQDLCE